MFIEPSEFPALLALKDGWRIVREEMSSLREGYFSKWPERDIYTGNWTVFGLYFFGKKIEDHCTLCPKTTALIESVPGLVSAGFSSMTPGTVITPHVGYTSKVLRCHVGLDSNQDCAIRVGNEVRGWDPGTCFVFDDTIQHEAWNKGQTTRIILLLDFKRSINDEIVTPPGVDQYRV